MNVIKYFYSNVEIPGGGNASENEEFHGIYSCDQTNLHFYYE